ncbi:MAG: alpha/beta hydrolase, partial [Bacillota bacterium]
DDAIPSSESRRLFEAARPGLAELWIVPGTRHVGARQVDPAAYDRRVIGFFEKTLGTGEL